MIPSALLSKVFPPGALHPGPPRPLLAPNIAEIGGGASKTNPAPVDGVPPAETVQALIASPSPQVPTQQEAEESNQSATDATQLPPP
jgi:hypothetical protein